MSSGGGADLCAPLIAQYQSIHNAPAYDMSAQSNEMQQAYAAYRQGIALVDSRADTILTCGQGGGPIRGMAGGLLRQAVSQAVETFGQARDAVKRAATISTESPLPDAVTRVHAAITMLSRMFQSGGGDCDTFLREYNALAKAPTYDVSAQPSNVQGAYSLYRQAIDLAVPKLMSAVEVCKKGGGEVGQLDWATTGPVLRKAENLLNQALSALGQ